MPIESATYVADLVATNPPNSDPVQQGGEQIRLVKTTLGNTFPNLDAAINATPAQINSWEGRIAGVEKAAPIGTVYMTLLAAAPVQHLLLNGGTHLRATYPALWAACGPAGSNVLGLGDGSTTFTTPDCTLRFPMGAGTDHALGTTGGSKTPAVVVAEAGAHTHELSVAGSHSHSGLTGVGGAHDHGGSTGGHAITTAQMPSHTHSGSTDVQGAHAHNLATPVIAIGGINSVAANGGVSAQSVATDTQGAHSHTLSINAEGGGQAHAHSISSAPAHTHVIFDGGGHTHDTDDPGDHTHAATIADGRPPFLAFHFIVKAL